MWSIASRFARTCFWTSALVVSPAFNLSCFSGNCPSVSPCMGASHEGLRVTVDLSQIEKNLTDDSFELRIESNDREPLIYTCTLGETCSLRTANDATRPTAERSDDSIEGSADLEFVDASTMEIHIKRFQGDRRIWGPERATLRLASDSLVRVVDLTPEYNIFKQGGCFDCRIASERWVPQP